MKRKLANLLRRIARRLDPPKPEARTPVLEALWKLEESIYNEGNYPRGAILDRESFWTLIEELEKAGMPRPVGDARREAVRNGSIPLKLGSLEIAYRMPYEVEIEMGNVRIKGEKRFIELGVLNGGVVRGIAEGRLPEGVEEIA